MSPGWTDKPAYEPAPPIDQNPWYEDTRREYENGACIYLIEAGEHYKIGITTDLKRRLASINCGLPHADATVIAVRSGGRDLEAQLHNELAHRRVKGEWFDKCDEVRDIFIRFVPAEPEAISEVA